MNLFINTCSDQLILALIEDSIIDEIREENNNTLSDKIMVLLNDLINRNNIKISEIQKIFIVTGPGSFTGIRIGLTIAKIISFSFNIPLIQISNLELLSSSIPGKSMPIIDARRGYVFGAIYDDLNPIFYDSHILLSDLEKQGNYPKIDNSKNVDILKVIKKNYNDVPQNPHLITPKYLKRTEAEEKNDKKNN